VILVGEGPRQRDAHIAVEAALTGHMVFTTLHTNSAAGSFTRLGEMGIEPFLVSASTVGVMAQACPPPLPECKEEQKLDEPTAVLNMTPGETVWKGKGCDGLRHEGRQRTRRFYEVMRMSPKLRKMVAAAR